jgi:hypothetical protein
MARDKNKPSGNKPSPDSQQSSRFDREAVAGQSSSEHGSSGSDRTVQRDSRPPREEIRDNQQIADDNEQSGVVDTEGMSRHDSDLEQAEGSREHVGGISNRGLAEEEENQSRVPPRGKNKEGGGA